MSWAFNKAFFQNIKYIKWPKRQQNLEKNFLKKFTLVFKKSLSDKSTILVAK